MHYFISILFALWAGSSVCAQVGINLESVCDRQNLLQVVPLLRGQSTNANPCDTLFILSRFQYRGAIQRIVNLKEQNAVLEQESRRDSATIIFYKNNIQKLAVLFETQNQSSLERLSVWEKQLMEAYTLLDSSQAHIAKAQKKIKQAKRRIAFNRKIKPILFVAGGAFLGYLAGTALH